MSLLFFVLTLIMIGIFFIYRYNKLPHPVITFSLVFAIMCLIYALRFVFMFLTGS